MCIFCSLLVIGGIFFSISFNYGQLKLNNKLVIIMDLTISGKKEMVYTNASKQLLIFQPPAVLTLHLKRFQQVESVVKRFLCPCLRKDCYRS